MARRREFGANGWREVSRERPCLGCGHSHGCRESRDGNFICWRVQSSRPRGAGWWHAGEGRSQELPSLAAPVVAKAEALADEALLHRIYQDLLDLCPLSLAHRKHLTNEGWTHEEIAQFRCGSLPAQRDARRAVAHEMFTRYGILLAQAPGFLVKEGARGSWAEICAGGGLLMACLSWTGQSPQLLHRDIKPANLIRETNTGKLTVVDFGLARNLEENQSALHTSVGTLGYSALEQLTGKPEVRSDLYSVGVTLHEMVSGIRPTLAGVEALTPKTMANFDPALSSIIARATDQDVQKRFASAEEFRQALLGWQGGKTVAIPAPVRPASPKRRRMTPVLLIVLLLAGALLWRLAAHHSPSPTRSDPGLQGDIFASRPEGRTSVVGLGEDVGLFWIEEANPKVTAKRAQTVVQRLNYLYHHQCLECGAFLLEPAGIRVGRFQQKETDELVVFYAHMHGDQYAYGPELLVTVDVPLARRLGATPRYVAGYWRNLIRDVVALSRGESSQQSPLGPTFAAVVTDLRQKGSAASLARLRAAVSALSSSQASLLQNAFRKVPEDFRFESDPFPEKAGFKPLVN